MFVIVVKGQCGQKSFGIVAFRLGPAYTVCCSGSDIRHGSQSLTFDVVGQKPDTPHIVDLITGIGIVVLLLGTGMVGVTVRGHPALGYVEVIRPFLGPTGNALIECGVTASAESLHKFLTFLCHVSRQDIDRRITAAEFRRLGTFEYLDTPDSGHGNAVTQYLTE